MDHRVSKDMISSGIQYSGKKSQEELGGVQYGSVTRPDSLMDSYKSIYSEDAKWGYDSKGRSKNPKDIKKIETKEEVEGGVSVVDYNSDYIPTEIETEDFDFIDKLIESGKFSEEEIEKMREESYTVHSADKKANTEAWKRYKAGAKNVKTGKPLYKKGDDVKDDD